MNLPFHRPDLALYSRTHPHFAAMLPWFGPWVWSNEALALVHLAGSQGLPGITYIAKHYENRIMQLDHAALFNHGAARLARRVRSSLGGLTAALVVTNGGINTSRRVRINGGPIGSGTVFEHRG